MLLQLTIQRYVLFGWKYISSFVKVTVFLISDHSSSKLHAWENNWFENPKYEPSKYALKYNCSKIKFGLLRSFITENLSQHPEYQSNVYQNIGCALLNKKIGGKLWSHSPLSPDNEVSKNFQISFVKTSATKVELISKPTLTHIFKLFHANILILKFRFC